MNLSEGLHSCCKPFFYPICVFPENRRKLYVFLFVPVSPPCALATQTMIAEREPICAAGNISADVWMQLACIKEATPSDALWPQTKHINQQQQCIRERAVQRRLGAAFYCFYQGSQYQWCKWQHCSKCCLSGCGLFQTGKLSSVIGRDQILGMPHQRLHVIELWTATRFLKSLSGGITAQIPFSCSWVECPMPSHPHC